MKFAAGDTPRLMPSVESELAEGFRSWRPMSPTFPIARGTGITAGIACLRSVPSATSPSSHLALLDPVSNLFHGLYGSDRGMVPATPSTMRPPTKRSLMTPSPAIDQHLSGNTARQTLFWNGYALGYDRAWDSPLTATTAKIVAAELSAAADIIDLGCGTGLFSARLTGRKAAVTGVDRSRGMLNRAVQRGRIAVAVQVDAAVTGLPAASCDAVICANILHLHCNPEAVLAEAVRLVRLGGRIAVVTPTEEATHRQVIVEERTARRGRRGTLLADLVRRQVAMVAPISTIRIVPPGLLGEILRQTVSTLPLRVITERTVGLTQRVLIIERNH